MKPLSANNIKVVGLMSGTSLDGLDLVAAEFWKTNEKWHFDIEAAETIEYSNEWKTRLKNAPEFSGLELIQLHTEYGRFLGSETKQFFTENVEENIDYPKIINEAAVLRLKGLIAETQVYCGGYFNQNTKHFAPTILTDVTIEAEIMKEEIFGPILPVLTFENTGEVLDFIQSREKPLSVYYFSEDRKKQNDFLNKTYSGNAGINDVVLQFVIMNLPFGGVGYSGMGAYHGKRSFDIFSHERSVLKTTTKFDFPLRYPPYKKYFLQLIRFLLR